MIHPKEIQRKKVAAFLEKIEADSRAYLISLGLTDAEYDALITLESDEIAQLSRYESYTSRKILVVQGIISIDDVKNDVSKSLGGN